MQIGSIILEEIVCSECGVDLSRSIRIRINEITTICIDCYLKNELKEESSAWALKVINYE